MKTTAFVVVFTDIVQKCVCTIIYRCICWNVVLALSSLEIVFLKWCFLEKKRNKANVTFAIYRGLSIEILLFSREMCSKLILRNLSFLLTYDFSPILLFFPTAFSCPVWQILRMLAPEKQFCSKCDSMDCIWWVETLIPYSHIKTSYIKDFHTDFYFFLLKISLLYFSYIYLGSS